MRVAWLHRPCADDGTPLVHQFADRPQLPHREAEAGVTFFTDNDEFLGNHVREQDPLYSVQGHVIYNFSRKLWAALDATYYTGGRTSVNGFLDNNLQRDSRWGATLAYSLTRRNSIKLYYNSGLAERVGTDFSVFGIAWQYRWGGGL